MQTNIYQGLKIIRDVSSMINDHLVVEVPLQINVNKEPYTVVMRTPGDDYELTRGLLYAEDIYKQITPLEFSIEKKENAINTIVNVNISDNNIGRGYLNKRTLLSVSSCGICGKQKLEDISIQGKLLTEKISFSSNNLFSMFEILQQHQVTFQTTGGSHAAGIFNSKFKLLTIKEDIGRHNAVDKCVGSLLDNNSLKNSRYLLVSGRVSYEIVSKAFLAKIPVIIAVSACSSMAVDYAKELGICLIGFTRERKMTVYSNPSFLKSII